MNSDSLRTFWALLGLAGCVNIDERGTPSGACGPGTYWTGHECQASTDMGGSGTGGVPAGPTGGNPAAGGTVSAGGEAAPPRHCQDDRSYYCEADEPYCCPEDRPYCTATDHCALGDVIGPGVNIQDGITDGIPCEEGQDYCGSCGERYCCPTGYEFCTPDCRCGKVREFCQPDTPYLCANDGGYCCEWPFCTTHHGCIDTADVRPGVWDGVGEPPGWGGSSGEGGASGDGGSAGEGGNPGGPPDRVNPYNACRSAYCADLLDREALTSRPECDVSSGNLPQQAEPATQRDADLAAAQLACWTAWCMDISRDVIIAEYGATNAQIDADIGSYCASVDSNVQSALALCSDAGSCIDPGACGGTACTAACTTCCWDGSVACP